MITTHGCVTGGRRSLGQTGFSLIELLVVMGIIGILTVLSMQGFLAVTRGSSLTAAGQFLRDGLEFARQTAESKNSTVEVRIYQLPANASSTPTDYRAFQIFLKGGQTTPVYTAVTKITYLPQPIVLSTDATKTTFLNLTYVNTGGQTVNQPVPGATPPAGAAAVSLPVYGTNYNYLYFCYTPSGGTNLPPPPPASNQWFATLVPKNSPLIAGNGVPSDFVTVIIDPALGNARLFHP